MDFQRIYGDGPSKNLTQPPCPNSGTVKQKGISKCSLTTHEPLNRRRVIEKGKSNIETANFEFAHTQRNFLVIMVKVDNCQI